MTSRARIAAVLRRSLRIAAHHRSMCGAPTSSLPRPMASALPRLCADRANRSPWYGDGRRGSWHQESIEGLTRDKTRKPGKQPLPASTVQRVVEPDPRTAAGRSNPLDRPDAGEGSGCEPAFGATYPRGPPTRTASYPHVQAVDRPEVLRSSRTSSASTSILPPMRSFSRSTRRAKSRRSTVPSRGCR